MELERESQSKGGSCAWEYDESKKPIESVQPGVLFRFILLFFTLSFSLYLEVYIYLVHGGEENQSEEEKKKRNKAADEVSNERMKSEKLPNYTTVGFFNFTF